MMDNLAIQATEAAVHANYPDCGGLLLVERAYGGSRNVDVPDGRIWRKCDAVKSVWRRRRRNAPWCGRGNDPGQIRDFERSLSSLDDP